jgi:hypothetical protein
VQVLCRLAARCAGPNGGRRVVRGAPGAVDGEGQGAVEVRASMQTPKLPDLAISLLLLSRQAPGAHQRRQNARPVYLVPGHCLD